MKKMTGLGRGLDALIDTSHVDTNGEVLSLRLNWIRLLRTLTSRAAPLTKRHCKSWLILSVSME